METRLWLIDEEDAEADADEGAGVTPNRANLALTVCGVADRRSHPHLDGLPDPQDMATKQKQRGGEPPRSNAKVPGGDWPQPGGFARLSLSAGWITASQGTRDCRTITVEQQLLQHV